MRCCGVQVSGKPTKTRDLWAGSSLSSARCCRCKVFVSAVSVEEPAVEGRCSSALVRAVSVELSSECAQVVLQWLQ